MAAKIVYLHGVGDGDKDMNWLSGLNKSLAALGHPVVDERDVTAPVYASLLKTNGVDGVERKKAPKRTYSVKDEREARRKFQIRQAKVAKLLAGVVDPRVTLGTSNIAKTMNSVKGLGVESGVPEAVTNYLKNPKMQNAILGFIIDQLPRSGELILIGHSLGSVIAIDLIDQLPSELHVRRFITIGSPASAPALHKHKTKILPDIPYTRIDDWSNLFYTFDPVSTGRGLGSTYGGAQDFRVSWPFKPSLGRLHGAGAYLEHPAAGRLIADVLYPGSDVVAPSSDIVARLDDEEASVLLTLAYGARIGAYLRSNDKHPDKRGSRAGRFEDALDQLRISFVDQLKERQLAGRGVPPEFEALMRGDRPRLPDRWDLSEAITRTTLLAFTNVIAPYEIEIGEAAYKVLPDLFIDLGFPGKAGSHVASAVEEVGELVGNGGFNLGTKTKLAAGAAGIALLAAGPIGLAVAGSATAVGAAAITSSLAAFGPGGMVGGLAMLGGLASTGSMLTTAAATVREKAQSTLDPTSIAIQVSIAYAHKLLGEPYEADLWYVLVDAETHLAAKLNMLEAYSDEKSPAVKQQLERQALITKLIAFMVEKGLEPEVVAEVADPERAQISP